MADNNKKIIFTVEVNDKGKVKVDGLTKGFVNLDNAVKKVNKSIIDQSVAMNQVSKTNQNMIDKTGLAGATIVELGRTISDSNYGIRGMANCKGVVFTRNVCRHFTRRRRTRLRRNM